jgi:3-hydroxymyristoyl/3-hydroxydecanoyl-(acyl carrier protein) dehydratase
MWHRIDSITAVDPVTAEAQVTVPPEAAWFDGHFPGMPLLPGIAQLAMVTDIIAQNWTPELKPVQFSRVRFKLKIEPATPVTIKVTRNQEKQAVFSFQIATPEGIACVGNLLTRIVAEVAT